MVHGIGNSVTDTLGNSMIGIRGNYVIDDKWVEPIFSQRK